MTDRRGAPEVTVVVPTYQRVDLLRRLLPSLEVLAGEGVEVIVVDDGSRDATPELLAEQSWAVVVSQANAGAAAARNAGWRRATAPIVAFLDDDCLPDPGWPTGLLPAFEDPQVVGVGGRIRSTGASWLDAFVEVERLVDHGRDLGDGVDYLVTANAAFRVEALVAVEGFDDGFPGAAGEDVDLSWRLRAAGGRLVRSEVGVRHEHRTSVPDILRTYRGHGRSRARLDERHPQRRSGAAARGALAPSMWRERWRGYRAHGVGVGAASALLVVRALGLASFALGLRRGRRQPS